MTIIIHFHRSGYRTFKDYYVRHVCVHLRREFPALVSYARFVELMPQMLDVDWVEAAAGQGLVGDRYFGVPAHYDAQITFVAYEVFRALQAEFGRGDWSPVLMRRNIVIEGIPLNGLIGQPFTLHFGDHAVEFLGVKHCAPCAWMDAMLLPGAQGFLRGRGGLRARIVTSGKIQRGKAMLATGVYLHVSDVLTPTGRPRLP